MVHIKSSPSMITHRNEYWKLESHERLSADEMRRMLIERGYDPGSLKSKDKLRECLRRKDLGLSSYIKASNDDLKELISNRGIGAITGAIFNERRDVLLRTLEDADYHPKFKRFTQLPPELRARIYKCYFAEFKEEALAAPRQPPLTLTCSLLRREALPLFYSACVFELRFYVQARTGVEALPRHLIMRNETLPWLRCTREENLADIQHLQVEVLRSPPSHDTYYRGIKALSLSLDLIKAERLRVVPNVIQNSWNSFNVDVFFKELAKISRKIKNREGLKLERKDFFALRRALEGACKVS